MTGTTARTHCSRINGLPGTACKTCGKVVYEKSRGSRWLNTPALTHIPPKPR